MKQEENDIRIKHYSEHSLTREDIDYLLEELSIQRELIDAYRRIVKQLLNEDIEEMY